MYKSKLLDLCPHNSDESLIKVKIIPVIHDGKVEFKGIGKNTVDVQDIQNRFDSLGIKTDWKLFKKIQTERNNIEHYYSNVDHNSLKSIIVSSLILMSDFIKTELQENPVALMGKTWSKLLKVKDLYLKEKEECGQKINSLLKLDERQLQIVKNIICPKCGSDLLFPSEEFHDIDDACLICSNCAKEISIKDEFENAFENTFERVIYYMFKDGGEDIIKTCPECGKNTFNEREDICYYCLYEKDYKYCSRCNVELGIDDQDSNGLCLYCEHMYNKLMNED